MKSVAIVLKTNTTRSYFILLTIWIQVNYPRNSMILQSLNSNWSLCINVHVLNHGGIASSGHCEAFPKEINKLARIFPRFHTEIQIIKLQKGTKLTHAENLVSVLKTSCTMTRD